MNYISGIVIDNVIKCKLDYLYKLIEIHNSYLYYIMAYRK